MKIVANGVDIEIEDSGGEGRPVVLLVMGLGMQLISWPEPLVDALVAAGYRVVRLDNRDSGLSQQFDHLGKPNLLWQGLKYRLGLSLRPPYTLHDMALDALGVLDTLGIDVAHVMGVSMGGMIAQRMALAAPQRVLRLVSVMSSSGARNLPPPAPHVLKALLGRPADSSEAARIAYAVRLFQLIGSPDFPVPEADWRTRVTASMARAYRPAGVVRQMAAILADRSRPGALSGLRCPTLVVHGRADALVPFACGEDTARRIPGAQLVGIAGMGHDLPPPVVARVLDALLPFLGRQAAGVH